MQDLNPLLLLALGAIAALVVTRLVIYRKSTRAPKLEPLRDGPLKTITPVAPPKPAAPRAPLVPEAFEEDETPVQIDGDVMGKLPMEFEIVPEALRVFAPPVSS